MSQNEDIQNYVAYFRVSTAKQGTSGLGLEAQEETVSRFINQSGGTLVESYTEVETGKGRDALSKRPQLAAALTTCRKTRSRLVLAKLDRLSRNLHFISGLLEKNVDFICADSPTKDRFRIHLEACFAEEEARRISVRTKEALAAAKARGVVLGVNGKVLAMKNGAAARAFAASISGTVADIREAGQTTIRAMTAELNRRGVPSARGGAWSTRTTHRLLKRLPSA